MAQDLQAIVGRRIAEARRAVGLSQSQLARAVDGATRTVQTWEAGQRIPRTTTFSKIALVTGKPVSWFYEVGTDVLEEVA